MEMRTSPPQTKQHIAVLSMSSALGLGYVPKAPGTFGTLAALPIWWAMTSFSWPAQLLLVLGVAAFSIWIAGLAERIYGGHDNSKIVIDEVAGMLVAVLGVPFAWPEVLVGFVLFRLFDIIKPFPIRWLDKHVEGGFGVVVDDLLAGVFALVLLHAFHYARLSCWGL